MKSREKISYEDRVLLLKNKYIYTVTESNIYFTEEFKELFYNEKCKGKSTLKIMQELGIPMIPIILKRSSNIGRGICGQAKSPNRFKRKNVASNIDFSNLRNEDLEKENEFLKQENEFLKKITKLTDGK